MEQKNNFQGSKEWLEMRQKFIGASDAPIILGLSPWVTPYQLWEQKLGFSKQEENEAMRRGTRLEPIVRAKYEDLMLDTFEPAVIINPRVPFMMASLDGLSSDNKKAVEIKCPNGHDHELAKNKEIPSKYFPQLQHQMACSGLSEIDYVSYSEKEGEIEVVTVSRDEEYIQMLIKEEEKFWNCVQNLQEPELCDRDFRERSEEWREVAMELHACNLQIKKEKARKEDLENKLRELSEGVNSRSGPYRYKVSSVRGKVDYSAIPELAGVDLDLYRKPNTQRWNLTKEKTDD